MLRRCLSAPGALRPDRAARAARGVDARRRACAWAWASCSAAHRALAAVDPADRERRLLRAARRALLAARRPRRLRRRVRRVVLRAPAPRRPSRPPARRGGHARAAARRGARRPGDRAGGRRTPRWCRPPGRTSSCCATRTSPTTRTRSAACARRVMRRLAAPRADAAEPAHAPARAAAARRRTPRGPTCAARSAPRCARRRPVRAPLARARRAPAPARARLRRVGLDGALRAHAARSTCRPAWPRAGAWRRSCSAPA